MAQWIKGSFFNTKNYFGKDSVAQKIIKSSVYKTQDNVDQGYKPNGEGNGVLYSWTNKPLAYYDVPTLNDMIFSRKLWEQIRSNPFIVAAIENCSFWGVLGKEFSFLLCYTKTAKNQHIISMFTDTMSYTFCIEEFDDRKNSNVAGRGN